MTEILILRLIHVLAGTIWVGAAVFSTVLLVPAMSALGPASGQLMGALRQRGLFVIMPALASLTILSGLRLMWMTSAGYSAAYFATAHGAAYAAGGAAAIVAFALGMTISGRLRGRVAALSAELARVEDDGRRAELTRRLDRAQRGSTVLSVTVTSLLVASAAGMAVARYLG